MWVFFLSSPAYIEIQCEGGQKVVEAAPSGSTAKSLSVIPLDFF